MQDDLELVRRAQHGDRVAFTEIYESHFDKIYRYITVKINNPAEAEDLAQQVFVRAYKSISSYKYQGVPFTSWLFRIAHNIMVDFVRKESKKPTVPLDENIQIMSNSDLEHETEVKFSLARVKEASNRLTEAQREVINLRFAGELSIAECAETMKKSEGAIKALQHSAIHALRKLLAAG